MKRVIIVTLNILFNAKFLDKDKLFMKKFYNFKKLNLLFKMISKQ